MGGAVIVSGLIKSDADSQLQIKKEESGMKNYYFIKEDKKAKEIEASPTLEQFLSTGKVHTDAADSTVQVDSVITLQVNRKLEKEYDDLQNEGYSDGFNPYR